jgi:hypothetical protein
MIGELSYLPRKPARYTPGGPLVRDGVSAPDFLYRVASSPLATDGVAWHPYQHSAWPTKAGPKGKVGIGKVDLTQDRIDGLFNKQAPCSSRLYRPPLQRGGRCTRPGLLYTEFGYFARNPKPTIYHTESRRAGMFKAALGRALRNDVKWMSIYHATEAADLTGIDYGVFASDGEVRGQRSTGKGPRPGYDNPQQRRAYCDGIRAFGIAERYPIESAPC